MSSGLKKILSVVGVLLAVTAVGFFFQIGPFKGLSQDSRDVDKFNELVTQLNGLQTGTRAQDMNSASQEMLDVSGQVQKGAMSMEEFKPKFVKAAHKFCAASKDLSMSELTILNKPDWPSSLEKERGALADLDSRLVKKFQACEEAVKPEAIVVVLSDLDKLSAEAPKLIDALNSKADSIAKVG